MLRLDNFGEIRRIVLVTVPDPDTVARRMAPLELVLKRRLEVGHRHGEELPHTLARGRPNLREAIMITRDVMRDDAYAIRRLLFTTLSRHAAVHELGEPVEERAIVRFDRR